MSNKSKGRIGLEQLNFIYGKGKVGEIRVCFDGTGTFEQKPYGCRSQWRKFRVESIRDSVRVFALGHQTTVR